jgi:hypothetical protein
MNWKHAGRPSTKSKDNKPEWLEQPWTKEEQSIISATERNSTVMLAIMVVKQWIRDGKPKSEFEGVRPWLNLIQESIKDKDNKQ